VANEGKFSVGAPTVTNATIKADVVEHFRGEKKIAFKMNVARAIIARWAIGRNSHASKSLN